MSLTDMTKLVTRLNAHAKQQPKRSCQRQAHPDLQQFQAPPPTKTFGCLVTVSMTMIYVGQLYDRHRHLDDRQASRHYVGHLDDVGHLDGC